MHNQDKILITVPASPYKILNVSFDADDRAIQAAFREFFRKNPGKGVRIGKNAQAKLIDRKERIKTDVFCCEVDAPNVELYQLKKYLDAACHNFYCQPLENPTIFSDLNYTACLPKELDLNIDFGEITYREDYAIRP